MLQPNGLTNVSLRLRPDTSEADLERLRAALIAKLNNSVKGLLIDCHDITSTNVDALTMLYGLKTFAESEGKRFAFCRVPSNMRALLKQHSRTFHFDLYGEAEIAEEEDPKSIAAPQSKRNHWHQVRRMGVVVGCALPIVVAVEYYIMFHGLESSVSTVEKSFEQEDRIDRFRVFGTVEAVRDGRRLPDAGATVMIWLEDSPVNAQNAWVTFVDNSGHYDFVVPFAAATKQLAVNVAIISDSIASIPYRDDMTQPAKRIEHISHPTRQSNVFQYLIQEGKPLRVNALFF